MKSLKLLFIIVFLMTSVCFLGRPQSIYAEARDYSTGRAYGVRTSDGSLILFRSNNTYSSGGNQTVQDIKGNSYTGYVYTSLTFYNDTNIKTVRVADGQGIVCNSCGMMFDSCSNLTSADLRGLDVSGSQSFSFMFDGCSKLTSCDLSEFDTSMGTSFGGMFNECSMLQSLDLTSFNFQRATSFSSMFCDCEALETIEVTSFAAPLATTVAYMFSGCHSLVNLDTSTFVTSSVTSFSDMFDSCYALTSINTSSFDTANATTFASMFSNCTALTSVDVSGFITTNIKNTSYMFFGCENLTYLDFSGWSVPSTVARSKEDMFTGCTSLSQIELGPSFDFKGSSSNALLPTPPTSSRNWTKIGDDGSIGLKTSAALRDNYAANAASWSGFWVWDDNSYYVQFEPGTGAAGVMNPQKASVGSDLSLTPNAFYRYKYIFTGWSGSDGNTYSDQETIPAGTFSSKSCLVLTAMWEENIPKATFEGGEARIVLHGGEKAIIDKLPGGTIYQVWEETPSGWLLVTQENVAGTVNANAVTNVRLVNEYTPGTATVSMMAKTTLDGRIPETGAFSFELLDESGNIIETVSNNNAGLVQFQNLAFNNEGDYTYIIREIRGDDETISYDSHEETITISVTEDGTGTLTAVSSSGGSIPLFENETKPGSLEFTKTTDGNGTGNEVFTFEVTLENEYGESLDNVAVLVE